VLTGPTPKVYLGDSKAFIDDVEAALYASKIVSYAQGYELMAAQAKASGWTLNNGGIALMWRGGCIIRSAVPRQDQGSLRPEPEADEPAAGSRTSRP
jgi:6-phosphogluconate dehydrogenase